MEAHSRLELTVPMQFASSVHCVLILTEESHAMPKLKRVILEERTSILVDPKGLFT